MELVKKQKKTVFSALILGLFLFPTYILLFQHNKTLFWIAFVLERIYSLCIEDELLDSIDNFDISSDKKPKVTITIFVIIVILCLFMLGYILIKYPPLFVIIILGEVIDKLIAKVIKRFSKN